MVATRLKECVIFDDADVPLYSTLLKMIVDRDWTAADLGARPSPPTELGVQVVERDPAQPGLDLGGKPPGIGGAEKAAKG